MTDEEAEVIGLRREILDLTADKINLRREVSELNKSVKLRDNEVKYLNKEAERNRAVHEAQRLGWSESLESITTCPNKIKLMLGLSITLLVANVIFLIVRLIN